MFSRTTLITGIVIAAFVVAVPAASAQTSQFTLAINGISPDGPTLETGTSHTMNADIDISGTGFVCYQESSIDVAVEPLGHAPSMGLTAEVAPSSVTFTIPAGAYLDETSAWSPNSQPVDFTMNIAEDAMKGHETYPFGVKAVYDGAAPNGCQSQGWNEAEGEVTHTVTIDYPEPVDEADAADGENDTDGGAAGAAADVEEGPGIGPLFLGLVAFAGLAAVRRRA